MMTTVKILESLSFVLQSNVALLKDEGLPSETKPVTQQNIALLAETIGLFAKKARDEGGLLSEKP